MSNSDKEELHELRDSSDDHAATSTAEPSLVFTERHCTFPNCLIPETEDYSICISDINNQQLASYMKTLIDDTGFHFTDNSYVCKSHVDLSDIVKKGDSQKLISESVAAALLNHVKPDKSTCGKICVICDKTSLLSKYSRLSNFQNIKFRNFLSKKHVSKKRKLTVNDVICKACMLKSKRRFQQKFCTPLKDIKVSCDVEECQEPAAGGKVVLESNDIFGDKLTRHFAAGSSRTQFCRHHKMVYNTDPSLCMICLKNIRKCSNKQLSKIVNLKLNKLDSIKEALLSENRSLPDRDENHQIHKECGRWPNLHLPSAKNKPAKRSLDLDSEAPIKKQNIGLEFTAVSVPTPEEAVCDDSLVGDDSMECEPETSTSGNQNKHIEVMEEDIREEALDRTVTELDNILNKFEVGRMSHILKIYNEEVQKIAMEKLYEKKLAAKKAYWLEQQIKLKKPQFELTFHFVSRTESSLVQRTGSNHITALAKVLKTLEEDDQWEDYHSCVEIKQNPMMAVYNFARSFNESIVSTEKAIKATYPDYEKISEFNLTNLLFTIDSKLFTFIVLVTMNDREYRLLDTADIDWESPGWLLKLVDFNNHHSYTRLIRRIYICYSLVFIRNSASRSPLHIAITDNIQKYSGSSELITNLNKLGICLNKDSFTEFKKNVVAELRLTGQLGVSSSIDPRLFFLVSADNTDLNFAHSNIRDDKGMAKTYHALGSMASFPSTEVQYPKTLFADGEPKVPVIEQQSSSSKKISKRLTAKTLDLPPLKVAPYIKPLIRQNPNTEVTPILISNFKVTSECDLKLQRTTEDKVLTLCCMKALHDETKCCNVKPSLKVALKTQGHHAPVAATCNFSLLNSPPDASKTLKVWLDFLKIEIIDRYGLTKLIVAGDGKTFGTLLKIVNDYPIDYSWVLLYLGEFHRNSVYMRCLIKHFAGAGLETLAKQTYGGSTLVSVLSAKHYRKTLGFILNVADSFLVVLINTYIRWTEDVVENFPEQNEIENLKNLSNKCLAQLGSDTGIQSFQTALVIVASLRESFSEFIDWAINKSESFHMWYRFVFKGVMPLIGSLEAVASGDWELNLHSSKQMIPMFFHMDATNYKHWSVADIIKKLQYPDEITNLLKTQGAFRVAKSTQKNAAMPVDMYHEVLFNKPLKSSIKHHKVNDLLLEVISKYLPYRSKLSESFSSLTKGGSSASSTNTNNFPVRAPEAERELMEVAKYIETLEINCGVTELFNSSPPMTLHSLSGLEASPQIKANMLHGLEDADSRAEKTIEEYITSTGLPTTRIQRTNPKLFPSTLDPKKKVKKPSTRQDTQRFLTMLSIVNERELNLSTIGKYQIGEDSAVSEEKGEKPYLGQQKSAVTNEYLKKRFPEAFSIHRPANVDTVVIDAESDVFVPPRDNKFTFEESIVNNFTNRFEPELRRCNNLVLVFDQRDFPDDISEVLKQATRSKRYENQTLPHAINISLTAIVPNDWSCITNEPNARAAYKRLVGTVFQSETISDKVPAGKSLYINGVYADGATFKISNDEGHVTVTEDIPMMLCEADVKVYKFLEDHPNLKQVLIESVDTDVLFIGLTHQARYISQHCTIQMGTISRSYCDMKELVNLVAKCYQEASATYGIYYTMQRFCQLYAATGCDFNPYLRNITKSAVFARNEVINQDNVLGSFEEFLKLMISVYESNRHYKNVSFSSRLEDPVEDISRLRNDIFFVKENEQATCPLASTLKLQFHRSAVIMKYWTDKKVTHDELKDNGWIKRNDKLIIKLQDETDPLYTFPRDIVKGCHCRKKACGKCQCDPINSCTSSSCETFLLTCQCKNRVKCTKQTCRNCPCLQSPTTDEEDHISEDEEQQQLEEGANSDSHSESEDSGTDLDEFSFENSDTEEEN